ncbi:MAG: hypothetical protein KKF44_10640 [Nanoarchaeota archaeon]|nr:hypothetical protein [Nanoarchaeota archaeon]
MKFPRKATYSEDVVFKCTMGSPESDCRWNAPDSCDQNCKVDADCRPSYGFCVNRNQEVYLPCDINLLYVEVTCNCIENICVESPTDLAAI